MMRMTNQMEQQFSLPNADAIRSLWKRPASTIFDEHRNSTSSRNAQSPMDTRHFTLDECQLMQDLNENPQRNSASTCTTLPAPEIHECQRAISTRHHDSNSMTDPGQSHQLPCHDHSAIPLRQNDSAQQNGARVPSTRILDDWYTSNDVVDVRDDSFRVSGWPPTPSSRSGAAIEDRDRRIHSSSMSALEAIRKLVAIAERTFGSSITPALLRHSATSNASHLESPLISHQERPFGAYSLDGVQSIPNRTRKFVSRNIDMERKSPHVNFMNFPVQPPQTSENGRILTPSRFCPKGPPNRSIGSVSGSTESDITSQNSSNYDTALARLTAECRWRRKWPQPQKQLVYRTTSALPSYLSQGDLANCTLATKVFIGGLPPGANHAKLMALFSEWGIVSIQTPQTRGGNTNRFGHAYLVFDTEAQVRRLLANCVQTTPNTYFFWMPSEINPEGCFPQVIPWATEDNDWVTKDSATVTEATSSANLFAQDVKQRSQRVFIGGLHGEVSAEGLQLVMSHLFGPVLHAGIDTDCHGYPSGSARVTFADRESFNRALSAGFVKLETARFTKRMQLDPFVDEAGRCAFCHMPTPLLCRHPSCLLYLCATCFEDHRRQDPANDHAPLMRPRTTSVTPHNIPPYNL